LVGLAGIIANAILLILLVRSDIGKAARLYRISCMITSILGLYTSFLLLILGDVPIFVDGRYAVVLYGPVLFYLPDRVNNILCVAFFTQIHTMWQIIPAPSIVQWMSLS
ncbi:hypothetical protein PENTCL1PPCAC_15139, partial [Pristionchus entomophagus]